MFKTVTIALSALALSGTVALAQTQTQTQDQQTQDHQTQAHQLEFPMDEATFIDTVPGASLALFETIDTQRDGFITEQEFEDAVEADLIEDPRFQQ